MDAGHSKLDRRLAYAMGVICVLGLGVAGYLTYNKIAGGKIACPVGGSGCTIVQKSDYAEFAGIPVPYLGLFGWITIIISLFVPGDIGRASTALLGVFGFFFSMYLTYLELFVIDAICQWCVANAVLMTFLAALAVWRLLAYSPPIDTLIDVNPAPDDPDEPEEPVGT
jgi:uncharacterized membrane protein